MPFDAAPAPPPGSDPVVYLLRAVNLLSLEVLASRAAGPPAAWPDWCVPRRADGAWLDLRHSKKPAS